MAIIGVVFGLYNAGYTYWKNNADAEKANKASSAAEFLIEKRAFALS